MRVEFYATLDDFVDVTERSLKRSKEVRSWSWSNFIVSTLLAGSVFFLAARSSAISKFSFALIGFGIAIVIYPYFHRVLGKRRLLQLCREQIGSGGPVKIEVELSEKGVWTKQLETEILRHWAAVSKIEESHDSIDVVLLDGTMIAVRKRAFQSEEEKQSFLQLANHLLQTSR